eukprot:CAMPEP_0197588602 /NCGR_PEP_ID=MMETSP1326-20131121/9829_1 /TAXON_ID=1155430 /ORGANISM="Genus nov. species nov., Strain RCC2288" /LENGTH=112 /DNA_ID=CAMNT_0043153445 /DNA_START=62 /DNA_END=400 /DNA_ORIENTATION=-
MPAFTSGVEFTHVAREWRLKWSEDGDKASLAAVQKVLDAKLAAVKAVKGFVNVQRVVCGGCHDYKVITKISAESFGDWEAAGFAPEAEFLAEVKAVEGVTAVETQTFTLESL